MTSHEACIHFFFTGHIPKGVEQVFYSSNRSESNARMERYFSICEDQGIKNDDEISLIVSSIGELTNNCFDHNLGYWKDTPGCCLSWSKENNRLTFCIADRGRGIVETLRNVAGPEKSNQDILNLAFETVITGRAPENRGNGLKYVCRSIAKYSLNSIKCFSNDVIYEVNKSTDPVIKTLPQLQSFGTLIFFQWRIL